MYRREDVFNSLQTATPSFIVRICPYKSRSLEPLDEVSILVSSENIAVTSCLESARVLNRLILSAKIHTCTAIFYDETLRRKRPLPQPPPFRKYTRILIVLRSDCFFLFRLPHSCPSHPPPRPLHLTGTQCADTRRGSRQGYSTRTDSHGGTVAICATSFTDDPS